MLRGGETLEIGWIVLPIILILLGMFGLYLKKNEKNDDQGSPYEDGRPTKKSNIYLALFLGFAGVMIILTIFLVSQ